MAQVRYNDLSTENKAKLLNLLSGLPMHPDYLDKVLASENAWIEVSRDVPKYISCNSIKKVLQDFSNFC